MSFPFCTLATCSFQGTVPESEAACFFLCVLAGGATRHAHAASGGDKGCMGKPSSPATRTVGAAPGPTHASPKAAPLACCAVEANAKAGPAPAATPISATACNASATS